MKSMRTLCMVAVLTLCPGSGIPAGAHGRIPDAMRALAPGKVLAVMGSDFLVPAGFRKLPGPMFYLDHAGELGLEPRQQAGIRKIAARIMPETVRAGRKIERMKAEVVVLSDGRKPFSPARIRRLLRRIGLLEAKADFEHIEAHRACLRLLRPDQKARLFSLLEKR